MRVIHLVRDPRGVANSLSKKRVARPHALHDADFMWQKAPAGAAARWSACQAEAELLRLSGLRVTRVRYEDLGDRPRPTIETMLAELGLPHGPSELAHIGDRRVALGKSHGLSGNPSRSTTAKSFFGSDEAWREQMSRATGSRSAP